MFNQPPQMVTLIDAFMFYNELDLLEYRLTTLSPVVDIFIIVESTHTHAGHPKVLYYQENAGRFKQFHDKIIHVIVSDIPFIFPNINYARGDYKLHQGEQWENETHQRNCIYRGVSLWLERGGSIENTWISICDLDEIPDPQVWWQIKRGNLRLTSQKSYLLEMDFYYYDLRHKLKCEWYGKLLSLDSYLKREWKEFRTLPRCGWHLSYFGDAEFISNKIQNFAHQEMNTTNFTDVNKIRERIETHQDLFDRKDIEMVVVDILENDYLPPNFIDWRKPTQKETSLDSDGNDGKDVNITSFSIHYHSQSSELCEIGAKYDTDKSSQRKNINNNRHCHPYTLFYHSLFQKKRHQPIHLAEIGILHGESLQMWGEYFTHFNTKIIGMDYDEGFLRQFHSSNTDARIQLEWTNVKDDNVIHQSFEKSGIKYDIILDDSTHEINDQIRIIKKVTPFLKPGGILIIEDIFQSQEEKEYVNQLGAILEQFQTYYFISMEHVNRNSTGWDNDKLFVLIKKDWIPKLPSLPSLPSINLTIITPCSRKQNLFQMKQSIPFEYVREWIIVYDGKYFQGDYLFQDKTLKNNDKITEYVHTNEKSACGNAQRNYALDQIKNPNTYLYYLDDDNIIHPNFVNLLSLLEERYIYTFDQHNRILGNTIKVCYIDTAMFLIDYRLCKDIRWILHEYGADGYYIEECYNKNKDKWIYFNNIFCYYNYLNQQSKYISLVFHALQFAENNQSKLPLEILEMEGMSGKKTRHFYNHLLNFEDARYLEIGTWKGSSVCSAMYGNSANVLCIDNWSEFGGPKAEFLHNFEKYKGKNQASFLEQDCFQVDVAKLRNKFNIFMYDGNHTRDSHYKALLHYYDCLDDEFIFIVDDWNWADVREGTYDAIKKLNIKILYEKEIRLTWDNSDTLQPIATETWWNGIYIGVLQKIN